MPGFVVRPAVQAVDHVPEVRGRGGMAEDVHFRLRKTAMADLSLLNKVLIGLDAGSLAAAQVFELSVFDDEIIGKAFVENGRDFLGRVMQPGIVNPVYQEANFFATVIVRRGGHEINVGNPRVQHLEKGRQSGRTKRRSPPTGLLAARVIVFSDARAKSRVCRMQRVF